MIIIELKVTAYAQEGYDIEEAVREFLLDDDRVSYCDVAAVSEKSTGKTFPDDDEGGDCEEEDDAEA